MLETFGQFGLAGLVAGASFLLAQRAIDRATASSSSSSEQAMPVGPACPWTGAEHDRWRKLERDAAAAVDYLEAWNGKVQAGGFDCVWRDRDEVLHLIEALKDSSRTNQQVKHELQELTRELRKQNGRH